MNKNKKKSFYFEDYKETEIYNKVKNSKVLKIYLNRVAFLSFIFFSLLVIFSIKIIYLSLSTDKNFYSSYAKNKKIAERRNIVDRNGSILATNVNLFDVGIRPKLLNNKEKKNFIN